MVNEYIDYMGAAVGFVLIFVSASLYMSGFAASGVAYNMEQNSATQAQNLLDQVLGSTGSPADWGASPKYPVVFGLKQAGAQPYTVDPLKALRLIATQPCTLPNGQAASCVSTGVEDFYFFYPIPYYVEYGYARTLLEAQPDFEFQLRFTPALNVSIYGPTVYGSSGKYYYAFPVRVYSAYGAPVADARVNGTLFAAQCSGRGVCEVVLQTFAASTITDLGGFGELEFTTQTEYQAYSVVALASVSGIRGLGFYTKPTQNTLVYVEVAPQTGNIAVVRSCTATPCSVVYPNITTYSFTASGLERYAACVSPRLTVGEGFEEADCSGLPAQGLVAIGLANSNCNGEGQGANCVEEALIAPVDVFGAFGLRVVYGGPGGQGPGASAVSATVMRSVTIGGFTYVASLTYWPDFGPVYGG